MDPFAKYLQFYVCVHVFLRLPPSPFDTPRPWMGFLDLSMIQKRMPPLRPDSARNSVVAIVVFRIAGKTVKDNAEQFSLIQPADTLLSYLAGC